MQDKIDRDYLEGNSIHWGITDKLSGNIVGTCGYYRGLRKGESELGCVLLPQYRNQGYMAAAMVLAIQFGRHNIGLSRIWAGTNRDNAAAVRLIEKLGFIKVADKEDGEVEYELMQQAR